MTSTVRRFARSLAQAAWKRSPWVRAKLRRLVRFTLSQDATVPPAATTFAEPELLARTDEFNTANERYFAAMSEDGKHRVGHKPYSDTLYFGRHLHDVGLLVHHLRLAPGDVVLELGAGTCWLSLLLNRFGCPTIAVDVSATALALGRAAFERENGVRWELEPQFVLYDGYTLPLPDGSVDRVICYDAFHHVPNQRRILAELARVLRPGGLAGMIEPGRCHSTSVLSRQEMHETGVLENDIVVEEVRQHALGAGFTAVNLLVDALGAGFEIPADRLPAFVAGDWLEEHWSRLTHHLVLSHFLLLYKGEFLPTTRRPEALRAEIVPMSREIQTPPGVGIPFRATVTNHGNTRFLATPPAGFGTTYLGAHLHRAGEAQTLAFDWSWLPLPGHVDPGQTVEVEGLLSGIDEPGEYRVVLDLVAHQVAWFNHLGSPTVELRLTVRPA